MKNITKITLIFIALSFSAMSISAQTPKVKADPIGKWNVSIPDAPDGFQTSKLTIAKVDDKYTAVMNFEEIALVINGEYVTFIDQIFKFTFVVEDTDVYFTLKFPEVDKINGIAEVVSDTEMQVTITATRIKDQK